jgi:hypothetical protein
MLTTADELPGDSEGFTPVIQQAFTRADLCSISDADRAMAFLSVVWSGPERHSRVVFLDAVGQLEREHPDTGASFWIVPETCDGFVEWASPRDLAEASASGCGAVAWLSHDHVVASELDAAECGAGRLVAITLTLWPPEPASPA